MEGEEDFFELEQFLNTKIVHIFFFESRLRPKSERNLYFVFNIVRGVAAFLEAVCVVEKWTFWWVARTIFSINLFLFLVDTKNGRRSLSWVVASINTRRSRVFRRSLFRFSFCFMINVQIQACRRSVNFLWLIFKFDVNMIQIVFQKEGRGYMEYLWQDVAYKCKVRTCTWAYSKISAWRILTAWFILHSVEQLIKTFNYYKINSI